MKLKLFSNFFANLQFVQNVSIEMWREESVYICSSDDSKDMQVKPSISRNIIIRATWGSFSGDVISTMWVGQGGGGEERRQPANDKVAKRGWH